MASSPSRAEPLRDIVDDHEDRIRAVEMWINRFQGALLMLSVTIGTGLTVTGLIFAALGKLH